MSLNSELTALMDKARNLTGLTDKISIDRLTGLMDYFDLHVNPNLIANADTLSGDMFLSIGVSYSNVNGHVVANSNGNQWSHFVCLVPLIAGKTYTFSETVSGPLFDGNVTFMLQDSKGSKALIIDNITIPDDESEHRVSYTFNVKSDGNYRVFFTNAKTFCLPKLEIGELSTPIQGGIAEVIQDSTTESVISEYIKATESNGITTLSSEEGGPSKRCLILATSDSTITDDMMLVMVARKSANSQYGSIDFRIGGFDALSSLTVSSSNWGLYSIHLKKSNSGIISLYCTEKGNLIDIRYFAVVKTAKYDN